MHCSPAAVRMQSSPVAKDEGGCCLPERSSDGCTHLKEAPVAVPAVPCVASAATPTMQASTLKHTRALTDVVTGACSPRCHEHESDQCILCMRKRDAHKAAWSSLVQPGPGTCLAQTKATIGQPDRLQHAALLLHLDAPAEQALCTPSEQTSTAVAAVHMHRPAQVCKEHTQADMHPTHKHAHMLACMDGGFQRRKHEARPATLACPTEPLQTVRAKEFVIRVGSHDQPPCFPAARQARTAPEADKTVCGTGLPKTVSR